MSSGDDRVVHRFEVLGEDYAIVIGASDHLEVWACAPTAEREPEERISALDLRKLMALTARSYHALRDAVAFVELDELDRFLVGPRTRNE